MEYCIRNENIAIDGSLINISSAAVDSIDTITNDTNDTKIEATGNYFIDLCVDVDLSEGDDNDCDTFCHNNNNYNNRNNGNTSDMNNNSQRIHNQKSQRPHQNNNMKNKYYCNGKRQEIPSHRSGYIYSKWGVTVVYGKGDLNLVKIALKRNLTILDRLYKGTNVEYGISIKVSRIKIILNASLILHCLMCIIQLLLYTDTSLFNVSMNHNVNANHDSCKIE